MEIIRGLNEKYLIPKISYPYRININKFKKYNKLLENSKLQNNYKKWKAGINYNTNKKIIIKGKLHTKLKRREFKLITELTGINMDEYLEETKKIYENIYNENILIDKYNEKIKNLLYEVYQLEKWEDFIMFEGKKYGIPTKVKGDIHVENNCLGKMKFIKQTNIENFNDIPFCNYNNKTYIVYCYECEKCNFKEQNNIIYKVKDTSNLKKKEILYN